MPEQTNEEHAIVPLVTVREWAGAIVTLSAASGAVYAAYQVAGPVLSLAIGMALLGAVGAVVAYKGFSYARRIHAAVQRTEYETKANGGRSAYDALMREVKAVRTDVTAEVSGVRGEVRDVVVTLTRHLEASERVEHETTVALAAGDRRMAAIEAEQKRLRVSIDPTSEGVPV